MRQTLGDADASEGKIYEDAKAISDYSLQHACFFLCVCVLLLF